ncbi:MAG: Tim44 domain-containing protein, partial [Romboutsia sp.]|nr:Tim44 domain-containing protein [Romboutsia sp.]
IIMLFKYINKYKRKIIFLILAINIIFISVSNFSQAVGSHSSHSSISSSGSSSNSNTITLDSDNYPFIIIFILLAIIVDFIFKYNSSGSDNNNEYYRSNSIDTVVKNIRILKQKDPNFSSSKFIDNVENIFLTLQDAWTNKNWEIARMYESDDLYNAHKRQLDEIIRKNRTNHIEDITILESKIYDCYIDEDFDVLDVLFDVTLIDYTIDNNTNKLINGNRHEHIRLKYIYSFIRPKGSITTENKESLKYCPSCGAPISINATAMCEYCNSVLINNKHDWILVNIKDAPHAE